MKNSVLSLLAAAALMACSKNEKTTFSTDMDSTTMAVPDDSATMNDTAGMPAADSAAAATAGRTDKDLSMQDKQFADAAAKGGMMEVMMGGLAAANANSAAVKALGAMMVKDHSKANDELKKWAAAVGYTLPAAMDADQQKKYDALKAKKGADFDRAYADLMVTDHKNDISGFKVQAAKGTEASLKSFASETLPTLEHHLKESEKTKAAVK